MAIKKSLRKGGRYILFKQHYDKAPINEAFLREKVLEKVGLIEMPTYRIILFDREYGIIKTSNFGLKKIILSLILFTSKGNRIEVLDSSGTIKSLKERNEWLGKRLRPSP